MEKSWDSWNKLKDEIQTMLKSDDDEVQKNTYEKVLKKMNELETTNKKTKSKK